MLFHSKMIIPAGSYLYLRGHHLTSLNRLTLLQTKDIKYTCKNSKVEYYEDQYVNLCKIKESNEFWAIINNLKGNKFLSGNGIMVSDWVSHFKAFLICPYDI